MKLSRAECIYLLEKAGMVVEEENVALNTYRDRILYNGERVGTVYYDSVSLSPHYLSINDSSVTVQYKAEDAVKRLEIEIERIVNYDFESEKRKLRADTVRKYFQERELKRLRRNELIASLERGEHLSREELRELSAMGYTI